MPYTMDTMPEAAKNMPMHAKEIWLAAFNAALKQYEGDESRAFATAMEAVKNKYAKSEDGQWRAKEGVRANVGANHDSPLQDEEFSVTVRLSQAQDVEGSAWEVVICEPGLTRNGWNIPEEAIREGAALFENVDVNLYELPQGASHLPDPLFDIKSLLVKNKVGWIDGVKAVAGRGLTGILHFLDNAKWIGKNILGASKSGGQVYGLSYDCPVRARRETIEGKSVMSVVKFLAADSVDIVTRPAAGGKFQRAVASRPAQNKEEMGIMKKKFWDLIKEKRPDLLEGKDFEKITDEEIEGLARMAMEPAKLQGLPAGQSTIPAGDGDFKKQLAILRCEMALKDTLAISDLPHLTKQRIQKFFSGRVFESKELDQVIADEKDYLAKMSQPPNPTIIPAGQRIAVGIGTAEKAQMACDRMFGLTQEQMVKFSKMERLDHQPFFEDIRSTQDYSGFNDVPAFSGLREMYAFLTGDPEVNGRFNRKMLGEGLRNCQDITSVTFTFVLGNTLGRRLVKQYRDMDYNEKLLISVKKSVKDFRIQEAVLVGGFPDIATVDPEAADYAEIVGVTDEESTYTVLQRGNLMTVTRKAIINDDISIITRLVDGLGRAARRTHGKYVWNFWINNATCSDGTAWHTVGHANLVVTAIGFAAVLTGYQALGTTTEKDSGERLGLLSHPDIKPTLVYPIDLMANGESIVKDDDYFTANDLTTKTRNTMKCKINGYMNSLLTDATDWGLIMPSDVVDIVEMGYLNGREEPEFFLADSPQSEQVFVADKIRYKLRHEYAGAVIDFRSGYKSQNP